MLHVTMALPKVRAERFQYAINHTVEWKDVRLNYLTNNMTHWMIIKKTKGTSSNEPVSESDLDGIKFLICKLPKF